MRYLILLLRNYGTKGIHSYFIIRTRVNTTCLRSRIILFRRVRWKPRYKISLKLILKSEVDEEVVGPPCSRHFWFMFLTCFHNLHNSINFVDSRVCEKLKIRLTDLIEKCYKKLQRQSEI